MNLKLEIAYDGSKYEGWQRQKKTEHTIQGKIEAVLQRYTGVYLPVDGAGRTDGGVHARRQVANVHIPDEVLQSLSKDDEQINTDDLLSDLWKYCNAYLPDDIEIIRVTEVAERFHARLSAKYKIYKYQIGVGIRKHVFDRRFMYHFAGDIDIQRIEDSIQYLLGEHDFASFCGNKKMKKSSVRTIYYIRLNWDEKEDILSLEFCGDGFLQYMIRIITGTLIEIGNGKKEPRDIINILHTKDRQVAGFSAPAKGLCLMEVGYHPYQSNE